ncbi:uncharacterized protein [Procambarus clarkii]|uniref:uncharacterized protein isoform X2 n=1 Tax=Procambarus clarkii TaxID=6728 RepID=UPI001E671DCB|nr:uncharacterized protein LOC123748770 [Procambarus clarkii]
MATDGAASVMSLLLFLLVIQGNMVRGMWPVPPRSLSHKLSNPQIRTFNQLKGIVSKLGTPVFPKSFGSLVPVYPKPVNKNQNSAQMNSLVEHTQHPLTQPVSSTTKTPVEVICYITNGTHYIPYNRKHLLASTSKNSYDIEITKPVAIQIDGTVAYQSRSQVNFHPDNPLICHLGQQGPFSSVETTTLNPSTRLPTESFHIHPKEASILHPSDESLFHQSEINVLYTREEGTVHPIEENIVQPAEANISQPPNQYLPTNISPEVDIFKPREPSIFHPRVANIIHRREASIAHPTDASIIHRREACVSHPTEANIFHKNDKSTSQPTDASTSQPTNASTSQPTDASTSQPTNASTSQPTDANISQPTDASTSHPTDASTLSPTERATSPPSDLPTRQAEPPSCDYSQFHAEHSAMLPDKGTCSISKNDVSQEERDEILKAHNTLRAQVARGDEKRGSPGPQPLAADMLVLLWNDELASVAQAWANQCVFDHDGKDQRKICSRDYTVGQNLYFQSGSDPTPNWAEAIEQWYNEVADVPKSLAEGFQDNSGKDIGHYTQMLWSLTREVGCGAVYYTEGEGTVSRVYVCNYGPMGNTLGKPMYRVGPPASECNSDSPSKDFPDLCEWHQSYKDAFR